ncbi:hypothetical protein B0H14DRAFT_2578867 [Mycena olivaceomarginata]|nr:hypothetical protein B0H14DRAFT_2578867 [Mycena olivaceomarginata]
MILLASHLGVYHHKSPRDLAYFLAYLSVYGGSLLILLDPTFPSCPSVDSTGPAAKIGSPFLSSVLTADPFLWTEDIYRRLSELGLVPANRRDFFYFTSGGRRVPWGGTVGSLGITHLSHLQFKLLLPGGVNGATIF